MTEKKQKTIAYIYASLDKSAIGTQSRIANDISGISVLARTCLRLGQSKNLDGIIVFCPASDKANIAALLENCDVEIVGIDSPISNPGQIKQRKWSLSSWRGGINEATVFDELGTNDEMILYLRSINAYGVLPVHGEAIFVDPIIIDELIEHYYENSNDMRFAFTQAPPGLCACLYRLDILHEMDQAKVHAGQIMTYNPKNPRSDLIIEECNYKLGPEIYTCDFRFIADTRRSFDILDSFINDNNDSDSLDSAALIARIEPYYKALYDVPAEINIEINTAKSNRIMGYPHNLAETREPMTVKTFSNIIDSVAGYDDICLTIGGIGEPLTHELLPEMLKIAKEADIFAINIETDGRMLDEKWAKIFADNDVDIISIFLDGHDDQENINEQIKAMVEQYKTLASGPLVVPHMVKCKETMGKMEEFFDYWLENADYAVIQGYCDYAGQIEDLSVMNMSPPKRVPCAKLYHSLTILADGMATICPLDFNGKNTFGNINEMSVKDIWQHEKLNELRGEHEQGEITNALCEKCNDWHRL